VVATGGRLATAEVLDPEPGPGQVLLDVAGCGICGSDLHALAHGDAQADVLADAGYPGFARSSQRVVFGHEFVGRVRAYGPRTRGRVPVGEAVVALPLLRHGPDEIDAIGLSERAPGAYAERVVVEESLMLAVPAGLSPELAVLTEPLAVAFHAVRRADVKAKDVAVVIGCGPVGLAVISMLKARGVATVIAADLSEGRRELARECGASVVVDPREVSPYAGDFGHHATVPAAALAATRAMDALRRLPVPWHRAYRVAEKLTGGVKRPVVFECVGAPGMLEQVISSVPLFTRVVVVGVCMQPDTLRPAMAINKEIDLRFVVGYDPVEFRDTLHLLAAGKVTAAPLLTGTVGLDGVVAAFDALATPERHCKLVIDPTLTGRDIRAG
jgi:threonine dehydrogenase-like Zn-dependent dehydrogenase